MIRISIMCENMFRKCFLKAFLIRYSTPAIVRRERPEIKASQNEYILLKIIIFAIK